MPFDGMLDINSDTEQVLDHDELSLELHGDVLRRRHRNCRENISYWLHTNKFQIFIICLVIFNSLLVITELMVDFEFLEVDRKDLAIPRVLHYLCIGILSLFMVEIMVKVCVWRKEILKDKMEVFDCVLVIVCFSLELAYLHRENLEAAYGLLIIVRLWRITRILNNVIMSVKRISERRVVVERRARESAEKEVNRLSSFCQEQEKEIAQLRNLLHVNGISFKQGSE